MRSVYSYLLIVLLITSTSTGNAQPFANMEGKLHLPPLQSQSKDFAWRLWGKQGWGLSSVTTVKKMQDSTFGGTVTIYTTELVNLDKEEPTNRLFSKSVPLNQMQAQQLYNYIQKSHVNYLPTDTAIKGWHKGMDGTTYRIEVVDSVQYAIKYYWTPSAQNGLSEAKSIQCLIDTAAAIVNMPERLQQFQAQVPFESWTNGGVFMKRNVSWWQRRKYRKERNAYRKRPQTDITLLL